MQVSRIQSNYIANNFNARNVQSQQVSMQSNPQSVEFAKLPYDYKYGANINFGSGNPNRTVFDIDYADYKAMTETTKRRHRKIYANFFKNKAINTNELVDKNFKTMPLQSEKNMDEFLKVAKIYSKYKEHPIICLGRSPKWFLNAALWMKDGIDDYKFVAFSKYWYRPDITDPSWIKRNDALAPTQKEVTAYRKYLNRISADPQAIVDNMKKTGKKTVITDYVFSGKGMTSFLDLMSKYAEDLGILEEFCNSIHIVGIGSKEYMAEMLNSEEAPTPKVTMPDRMKPFEKQGLWDYKIKQDFYDIDYQMFKEMLINQNTNECRSTYYPHETWTLYQPDRFKTGLIKDVKKVKAMLKQLKGPEKKSMSSFDPAMCDYRNLLNFRILDALNARGILKAAHKARL